MKSSAAPELTTLCILLLIPSPSPPGAQSRRSSRS